jgi:hypothetical protein
MILQLFINEQEIRSYFESCGFSCKNADSGYWNKASHGRTEWVETLQLVVEASGKEFPAKELLEKSIKNKLLSADESSRTAIKKALNNF